jgi:hypothetical protein
MLLVGANHRLNGIWFDDKPLAMETPSRYAEGGTAIGRDPSEIVRRAHERGVKVFGATIMPFEGAGYYSREREKVREPSTSGYERRKRLMQLSISIRPCEIQ